MFAGTVALRNTNFSVVYSRRTNLFVNFASRDSATRFFTSGFLHGSVFPPVSTKLAKLVEKFADCVVDTSGKFATIVVDTSAVVHLDLRISPQIFEKIRNGPNGILWGWGKLIHEKIRSKKSRDTVPLKRPCPYKFCI
jgi:hypothetical protein